MTDILAIGAHPDDVELGCAGTLLLQQSLGNKVAIVDLTQGELGTRGSGELRLEEARAAAKILDVSERLNLGMADGFFTEDQPHILKIVEVIRYFKPRVILCNAIIDRHPDHGRAASLIRQSAFYAGLRKIETEYKGQAQEAWRPEAVYHYTQFRYVEPDFLVDVTSCFDKKMAAIKCYKSQFYNPDSNEPETFISTTDFLDFVEARMIDFGKELGVKYAEGFNVNRVPGVQDILHLK